MRILMLNQTPRRKDKRSDAELARIVALVNSYASPGTKIGRSGRHHGAARIACSVYESTSSHARA